MTSTILTVSCYACETTFPVDPEKVPEGGVRARCSVCGGIFLVEDPRAVVDPPPRVPPLPTADRLGDAAFPEAGPEPALAPEPWSGLEEEEVEERVAEPPVEEDLEEEDVSGAAAEVGLEPETDVDDEPTPGVVEREEPEVFQIDDVPPSEPDEAERPADVAEALDDFTFAEPVLDPRDQAPELSAPAPPAPPEPPAPAPPEPPRAPEPPAPTPPEPPTAPELPEPPAPAPPVPPRAPEPVREEPAPELPAGFQFGRRDPHEKARRLARVLVSDIITYNPERYLRALENDTLAADFEEEIQKSWKEYVEQVGRDLASSTDYWTDALNDLLARGRDVF